MIIFSINGGMLVANYFILIDGKKNVDSSKKKRVVGKCFGKPTERLKTILNTNSNFVARKYDICSFRT